MDYDEHDIEVADVQAKHTWQSVNSLYTSKTHPKQTKATRYLHLLKSILLYSLALWGLFSVMREVFTIPTIPSSRIDLDYRQMKGCDCGDSVAEALSRGCKFDALSMAWLPEHCRDDELTAEFDTTGKGIDGTWVYYADTEHTIEIDVAEVAAMGDDPSLRVHMDKDWHQTHCLYYWLKLHRARTNGKIIEPRSDTEDHIRHCGMIFREPGYGTISGVALNTNEAVPE